MVEKTIIVEMAAVIFVASPILQKSEYLCAEQMKET